MGTSVFAVVALIGVLDCFWLPPAGMRIARADERKASGGQQAQQTSNRPVAQRKPLSLHLGAVAPGEWVIAEGEIWRVGKVRLIAGEAVKLASVGDDKVAVEYLDGTVETVRFEGGR